MNTSLYAHTEQVGWKSKSNVYQVEQYIVAYQSYSYKMCYLSSVQYKSWIPDKCQMCTIEMLNVHNTNIKLNTKQMLNVYVSEQIVLQRNKYKLTPKA